MGTKVAEWGSACLKLSLTLCSLSVSRKRLRPLMPHGALPTLQTLVATAR